MFTPYEIDILRTASLERADWAHRQGLISDLAHTVYSFLWRNGAFRFSSILACYEDETVRAAMLSGGFDAALLVALDRARAMLAS